jgi:hypothetical protein
VQRLRYFALAHYGMDDEKSRAMVDFRASLKNLRDVHNRLSYLVL